MACTNQQAFLQIATKRFVVAATMGLLLFLIVMNAVWLYLDRSDQIAGYEHSCLNNALWLHDYVAHDEHREVIRSHGNRFSLFYLSSVAPLAVFGINDFGLLFAVWGSLALLLFFVFKIARHLSGNATAGWFAVAFTATSPYFFGLSRRFSPWPLTLALFLAAIYALLLFRESPSLRRALVLGVAVVTGLAVPYEATLQSLFLFFIATYIAVVFVGLIRSRTVSPKAIAGYVAVLLGFLLLSAILPTGQWAAMFTNLSSWATEPATVQSGGLFFVGIPAYVVNLALHSFSPISVVFFLILIGYGLRHVECGFRGLLVATIICFVIMSLIPKKNTWYILEIVAILPILAACGLVAWSALSRKAILVAIYAVLALQVALVSFAVPMEKLPFADFALERPVPIAPKVDRVGRSSYRALIESNAAKFANSLPQRERISLGLLVGPIYGLQIAPYFLRKINPDIWINTAPHLPSMKLGEHLDAVLILKKPGADCSFGISAETIYPLFFEPFRDLWWNDAADFNHDSAVAVATDLFRARWVGLTNCFELFLPPNS